MTRCATASAIGQIPVPSTLADHRHRRRDFEAGERALGDAYSAGLGSDAEITQRHMAGSCCCTARRVLRMDWDTSWRCVCVRASCPSKPAENDGLCTPGMYWEDMCDYLDGDAVPDSASTARSPSPRTRRLWLAWPCCHQLAGCEIRVSWTPLGGTGPHAVLSTPAHSVALVGRISSDPPSAVKEDHAS